MVINFDGGHHQQQQQEDACIIDSNNDLTGVEIDLPLQNSPTSQISHPNQSATNTTITATTTESPNPSIIKQRKKRSNKSNRKATTKSIFCDICDEKFSHTNLLRSHRKICLELLVKPYKCDQCIRQFNFEKNYQLHLASHLLAPAKCLECGIIFQRTSTYRGHIKTHIVNDNFQCERCEKHFEFEIHYIKHFRQVHQNDDIEIYVRKRKRNPAENTDILRRFECETCKKRFSKPSNLERHEIGHLNLKDYKCSVCSRNFAQKSSLTRHMTLHTAKKNFKCPKCFMSFNQRGNLITHMKRVHPKESDDTSNKYPCKYCSCVFSKLNSHNTHVTKMHETNIKVVEEEDDEEEEFSVENVMKQLKSLENPFNIPINDTLQDVKVPEQMDNNSSVELIKIPDTLNPDKEGEEIIVKKVYIDDVKHFGCLNCSKAFKKTNSLLRHLRVHSQERQFECNICGKRFALKGALQAHSRIHHKDGENITKFYKCNLCFSRFNSLRQLDRHAKVHANIKMFSCTMCNKSFSTSTNLRTHQKIHLPKTAEDEEIRQNMKSPIILESNLAKEKREDERQHQCAICGVKFKRATHLKEHENTHLGLKRFQCLTCHKKFSTSSSLNQHRKLHLGEKSKLCHICNAKFLTNSELKRHLLSHSNIRNILCPYCDKAFKSRDACRTHIFTHKKDILQKEKEQPTEISTDPPPYEYVIVLNDDRVTNYQADNILYLNIPQQDTESHIPPVVPPSTEQFIEIKDLANLPENISIHSIDKPESPLLQSDITTDIPKSSPIIQQSDEIKKKSGPSHICKTCNKTFRRPIDLRRHQRTHTKEKPFECDICQKCFSLKSTLETHRATHNDKRIKLNCQVCNKEYSSKCALKIHLMIHTGERPYHCHYCSKTFRTAGNKISHMRTHLKSKDSMTQKKNKR